MFTKFVASYKRINPWRINYSDLFNKYILTRSSERNAEEIDIAFTICLMYILLPNSKNNDVLSIDFHRSIEIRERERNNKKKTINGNHHVRFLIKDVFKTSQHEEASTSGLR